VVLEKAAAAVWREEVGEKEDAKRYLLPGPLLI
jgi:hypothetical protein